GGRRRRTAGISYPRLLPGEQWRAGGRRGTSMTSEVLMMAASAACSAAFYVGAALVIVIRRPLVPPTLPATSDVAEQSPAVANLLANGGTVTPDAVPATLLDLAARKVLAIEESEPHVYECRIE